MKKSTKKCPKCASTDLMLFHSTDQKKCLKCGHEYPWPLDPGQKSLLIKGKVGY